MIYLISGKKGSGKDTVANYINKRLSLPNLSFAEPIKDIVKDILNLSSASFSQELKEKKLIRVFKFMNNSTLEGMYVDDKRYKELSVREILQSLGQHVRENIDKDFWVNLVLKKVSQNKIKSFTVSDVRYINEIECIKKNSSQKVVTIRIERLSKNTKYNKHASETELDNYEFDYVIKNNGTFEDLYTSIDKILLKEER